MKKVLCIALVFLLFCSSFAFALETALFDMRNNIFKEARAIKPLMAASKDVILLSSMWDSCLMAVSQLDGYFSMVGIFNEIKQENITDSAIAYLADWLNTIKATNEINIKSLSGITKTVEPKSKVHVEILKAQFSNLNKRIDSEIQKVSALKASIKKPSVKK